nr:hypothetical protein 8 [bacterium]
MIDDADQPTRRLSVNIPCNYHEKLKKYSKYRGVRMNELMLEMIDLIIKYEPTRTQNYMVEMLYGDEED